MACPKERSGGHEIHLAAEEIGFDRPRSAGVLFQEAIHDEARPETDAGKGYPEAAKRHAILQRRRQIADDYGDHDYSGSKVGQAV